MQALDGSNANAEPIRRNVKPLLRQGQQRLLSTHVARMADTKPTRLTEVDKLSRGKREPWSQSAVAANQKDREYVALRQASLPRATDDTPNLAKLGKRDPRISESEWNRRKRELRHLQDPLELATFVRKELGKDKVAEMLQLVRMASHSMECVVSWNHIIDHYLSKEKVNDALKVYNDVCVVYD